jgi:hypothetical protein
MGRRTSVWLLRQAREATPPRGLPREPERGRALLEQMDRRCPVLARDELAPRGLQV